MASRISCSITLPGMEVRLRRYETGLGKEGEKTSQRSCEIGEYTCDISQHV